jgi:manganese transport protein
MVQDGSTCAFVLKEIKSLLYWSMLAACTVGPGTVVVCSKSGTDFGLALLWALVVASFVAYTLQEASARLTIVSGKSLGQAMQIRFGPGSDLGASAMFAAVIPASAIGIIIGNTAYQANCFVGGMAALYVLFDDSVAFRIIVSILFGVSTYGLLVWGDVDSISTGLGVVVLLMTVVFGISAGTIGADAADIFGGFVPGIPGGAEVLVLSLIGTTAIPFNVFLASSLSKGFTMPEMQVGAPPPLPTPHRRPNYA